MTQRSTEKFAERDLEQSRKCFLIRVSLSKN